MISIIQMLNVGTDAAWWALLLVFFVAACRSYPLPAFRWIAAHVCVAFITVRVEQWLIIPFQRPAGSMPSGALGVAVFSTTLIGAIADFVVLVLALSEISMLISKVYPETRSGIVAAFVRAHGYVGPLGVSAVALALIYPAPILIYRLTHGIPAA